MDSEPTAGEHWQGVYQSKEASRVSWYRPHLDVSLRLLDAAGLKPNSRLIDVGGGASTLVDDLLARGVEHLTVLDLAPESLETAKRRVGKRATQVEWLAGDVTRMNLPAAAYDFWHDRAVLHFLTEQLQVAAYAEVAAQSVCAGGIAVIAGFAPDGPERCSGLPVARRSANDIAACLGSGFELIGADAEQHRSPGGSMQSFAYAVLRRRIGE